MGGSTSSISAAELGTITKVESTGEITFIPWGKEPKDAKSLKFEGTAAVRVAGHPAKLADLKPGMWSELEDVSSISAGWFVQDRGKKLVIFEGDAGRLSYRRCQRLVHE